MCIISFCTLPSHTYFYLEFIRCLQNSKIGISVWGLRTEASVSYTHVYMCVSLDFFHVR